jgi:hypothetical protein
MFVACYEYEIRLERDRCAEEVHGSSRRAGVAVGWRQPVVANIAHSIFVWNLTVVKLESRVI